MKYLIIITKTIEEELILYNPYRGETGWARIIMKEISGRYPTRKAYPAHPYTYSLKTFLSHRMFH